jgi:hypothetical protein
MFRLRLASVVASGLLLGLVVAGPAWAHSGFDPSTVPAASATSVILSVENERSDAGTVKVQLHFPDDARVVLAERPVATGWNVEILGGEVGEPVTDVVWSRPSAAPGDDPALSITLGPFPDGAGRLQFKVLQTYSSGDVDRWIQDWPAGAPEPDRPGPVLEVTGPAPTTSAPTISAPATTAAPTTAPATTTTTTAAEPGDGGTNAGLVAAIVVLALAGLGGLVLAWRRRRP